MEAVLSGIANYLSGLSANSPKIMALLAIAYLVGVGFKIVRSAIEAFILETPSKDDDYKLEKIKKNNAVKVLLYVMDLLLRFRKPEVK